MSMRLDKFLSVTKTASRSEAGKAAKQTAKSAGSTEKDEMRSFDPDDFFSHALDRSYGKKD